MEKTISKYAVIDCETTIFANGNPFSDCNRLCLIGVRTNALNEIIPVEYDSTEPYADGLNAVRERINSVDTVVLFNAKFDLNWLARYGIILPEFVSIFDCQLAEFILGNQRPAYPSLSDCCVKRGLGSKSTYIDDTYWSRGIDTPDIPLDELTTYLNDDLRLTDELYLSIQSSLRDEGSKTNLIKLHCQDLRVLQEMEFNGERFSWDSLADAQVSAERELGEIDEHIRVWVPAEARSIFNIDSGDHLSALLYGGVLRGKRATPYQRQIQTGPRAGETVNANKWTAYEYHFEGLVKPPKGSELKKDGFYSTDEGTLLSLPKRRVGPLVTLLLRRSELAKLCQTYYAGIPKIASKYDWKDGFIHGTLNQCRVITGRLSSEKPNKQNFPGILNQYIVSRF